MAAETTPHGLTRREALKRGATVAGALVWATPVVQAVGMSRALAQDTSPVEDCCEGGGRRKIASLTMLYLGGPCPADPTSGNVQAPGNVTCADTGDGGVDPVWIVATNKEEYFQGSGNVNPQAKVWFNGEVPVNGEFVVDSSAEGGELSGETWIHIFACPDDPDEVCEPAPDNEIQRISFHTSCSQPLRSGDIFGTVKLVSCVAATPAETTAEAADAGDCCRDGEGIGSLTLQYKGWDREVMVVATDTDEYLTGSGKPNPSAKVWFQGLVPTGGILTLTAAPGGTLGKSTWLHVSDRDTAEALETVLIPTSCDQPVRVGDLFGPFDLLACSGPTA